MAALKTFQTSASLADPVSSAQVLMFYGLMAFLFFGFFGAVGLEKIEPALLIVSGGGAILVGIYGSLLYQAGRLRIPFSDSSLEDVEEPVAQAKALARIERFNSVLRELLSWGLRLLGLFFMCYSLAFLDESFATVIFLSLGVWIYAIGTRIGAKSAIRLLAESEDTPHILYLRSFKIDDAGESVTKRIRWWRPKALLQAREEPVLSEIFSLLGPVIAVGVPGEPIPQLGAARMYLSPNDWKDQVQSLIDDASSVLLRVGNTQGFLWEVERVLQTKDPKHVLFYFSPSLNANKMHATYSRFRKSTEHLFQKPLPQSIGMCKFLSFESDWSANAFGEVPTLPPPDYSFFLPRWFTTLRYTRKLQVSLGSAIRPFFAGLGHELGETPVFGKLAIAVATFLGGPLTGGIMMAKSLLAVGESKWAVGIVIITTALALLMIRFEHVPFGALHLLSAFGFYNFWKVICDNSLQVHIRTGGRRVSVWVTAIIIFVASFVWVSVLESGSLQEIWNSIFDDIFQVHFRVIGGTSGLSISNQ